MAVTNNSGVDATVRKMDFGSVAIATNNTVTRKQILYVSPNSPLAVESSTPTARPLTMMINDNQNGIPKNCTGDCAPWCFSGTYDTLIYVTDFVAF